MPLVFRSFFILTCFLILTANPSLNAQNQTKGLYVIHAASKIPVPDALVQSEDLHFSATTDENGFVSLNGLSPKTNKVFVSHIGYAAKEVNVPALSFHN